MEDTMSVNDERYQDMYKLLVEQLLLRPHQVIDNINALIQDYDINYELKLLHSDPCKCHHDAHEHMYQFPFATGEGRKGGV